MKGVFYEPLETLRSSRRRQFVYVDGSRSKRGDKHSGCAFVSYIGPLNEWQGSAFSCGPTEIDCSEAEIQAISYALSWCIANLALADHFIIVIDSEWVYDAILGGGPLDTTSMRMETTFATLNVLISEKIRVMNRTGHPVSFHLIKGHQDIEQNPGCEGNVLADEMAKEAMEESRAHGYGLGEWQKDYQIHANSSNWGKPRPHGQVKRVDRVPAGPFGAPWKKDA